SGSSRRGTTTSWKRSSTTTTWARRRRSPRTRRRTCSSWRSCAAASPRSRRPAGPRSRPPTCGRRRWAATRTTRWGGRSARWACSRTRCGTWARRSGIADGFLPGQGGGGVALNRRGPVQEVEDDLQLLVGVALVQGFQAGHHGREQLVEAGQPLPVDLHDDAAAVLGVTGPPCQPLGLQPVDQVADGGGGQAGVPADLPRRQRAEALQQVDGLLLAGAEAHPLAHGRVVHDGGVAVLPPGRGQRGEQFLSMLRNISGHASRPRIYFVRSNE